MIVIGLCRALVLSQRKNGLASTTKRCYLKNPTWAGCTTLAGSCRKPMFFQKGDTLHYVFYNKSWDGAVRLKGLHDQPYRIRDYVNNIDLGVVNGPEAELLVSFIKHLLNKVYPEQ